MKPLKLEFTGLNSYRDRQTVDFERLGEGGLFGIFGPTGSGKSSILDAITLSLYGKVDRASKNTRGIINQREKAAEVSFTFALGGSSYRVQRRYERSASDPESARSKSARLMRTCDTGDEVLADKPETVTGKVQEIIGLTCSEFCRAVVLPQGKFDQFLTLTGADRADMLGHILNLDRFGDPLYNAAVRRRDKWQREVDGIERAKAELGDCSDAAVAQAQCEADSKHSALIEAEAQYAKVKTAFDETSGLKSLTDQLHAASERKTSLERQRPSVEKDQASLDAARRAAPLRNTMYSVKRLTQIRNGTVKSLGKATCEHDAARQALDSATAVTKAAREEQEREEPVLTARKTRMEEALGVQSDLDGLAKREGSSSASLKRMEQAVLEESEAVDRYETELSELTREVEVLTARQSDLAVDPGFRTLVDEALSRLPQLQTAEGEHAGSEADLQKKIAATEKARVKALQLYTEVGSLAASMYSFDADGNLLASEARTLSMQYVSRGEELIEPADQEVDLAANLLRKAGELATLALIRDQAVVLANELHDGQPCPVCGSVHHPSVAKGDSREHLKAQEAQRTIESCLTRLQTWRKSLQAAVAAWDNCKMNELDAWERTRARAEVAQSARVSFLAAAKETLGDSYSEETAQAAILKMKKQIVAKDRDYVSVTAKIAASQTKEKSLRKQLDDARARLSNLEKQRDATAKELALLEEQIVELRAKVRRITGGEDPSHSIAEADTAIRVLRDRVKQAQDTEDSRRKEAESLVKQVASLESALFRTDRELESQDAALTSGLAEACFGDIEEAERAMLTEVAIRELDKRIRDYSQECSQVEGQIRHLEKQIGSKIFSEPEFQALQEQVRQLESSAKALRDESAVAQERLQAVRERRNRWHELEAGLAHAEKRRDIAARLVNLVRGKSFVKFLAREHLRDMAADSSARLGDLTNQRYALEIAGESDFIIRDDFNGGERRSVGTLSGGETFLTSLSLALALSSKVQLRGQYPLGFFFLDEGFGTLDEEKLDAVISALERLQDKDRTVGVISHVKELKERLPYYLEVVPATDSGIGSRVSLGRR